MSADTVFKRHTIPFYLKTVSFGGNSTSSSTTLRSTYMYRRYKVCITWLSTNSAPCLGRPSSSLPAAKCLSAMVLESDTHESIDITHTSDESESDSEHESDDDFIGPAHHTEGWVPSWALGLPRVLAWNQASGHMLRQMFWYWCHSFACHVCELSSQPPCGPSLRVPLAVFALWPASWSPLAFPAAASFFRFDFLRQNVHNSSPNIPVNMLPRASV